MNNRSFRKNGESICRSTIRKRHTTKSPPCMGCWKGKRKADQVVAAIRLEYERHRYLLTHSANSTDWGPESSLAWTAGQLCEKIPALVFPPVYPPSPNSQESQPWPQCLRPFVQSGHLSGPQY